MVEKILSFGKSLIRPAERAVQLQESYPALGPALQPAFAGLEGVRIQTEVLHRRHEEQGHYRRV